MNEASVSTYADVNIWDALGVRTSNEQIRVNKNSGYQNSNHMDSGGGHDIPDFLKDGRHIWQPVWESEA